MILNDVYIVKAKRTAFGRFGGSLRDFPSVELGAAVINELLRGQEHLEDNIQQVFLGSCLPGSGFSPARQAVLAANLPKSISAFTIDRACCSALSAIGLGAVKVQLEDGLVIAGGMENMSRTPYLIPEMRWGQRLGDIVIKDELVIRNPYINAPMAQYAGEFALSKGVERNEQDEWAFRSQQCYHDAQKRGLFFEEIFPLELPKKKNTENFGVDEHPRPGATIEKLSRLETVYDSPTVTAGNASGLADGGAAIMLASGEGLEKYQLKPLAKIKYHAALSGEPRESAILPGYAIKKALSATGINLSDLKLIEINEAFAAMPTVSTLELADWDRRKVDAIRNITNVNGGAIAIGHPLGATGARLVATTIYELRRRGGGYAAVGICGALGQVDVVILEV